MREAGIVGLYADQMEAGTIGFRHMQSREPRTTSGRRRDFCDIAIGTSSRTSYNCPQLVVLDNCNDRFV
jgi:hypothetical protein